MKMKFLILVFSAFTSGIIMAQGSLNSEIEDLIQMQTQDSFSSIDLPSGQNMAPQINPNDQGDIIVNPYVIAPGDSVLLNFLLLEDFVLSGDLNNFLGSSQSGATSLAIPSFREQELDIRTSYGPLEGLRSEYNQFIGLSNINQDAIRNQLQEILARLNNRNPYNIDSQGMLNLPGFPAIPLQGLTADEAALRIRSQPGLDGLVVGLTIISSENVDSLRLSLYGQEIFENSTLLNYAPGFVPGAYVVRTGDRILVQLFGSTNYSNVYTVLDNGSINLPEIGPIQIAGIANNQLNDHVNSQILNSFVGTNINASVISSNPIEIFVSGEVVSPGIKIIRSNGSLIEAIVASGGITDIASIRTIKIIRDQTVTDIDLYDFLLRGESEDELSLLSGDVVLINPVRKIVGVSGMVRRSFYFELLEGEGYDAAINFAGGILSSADEESISILRQSLGGPIESVQYLEELDPIDRDIVNVPLKFINNINSVSIVGPHIREGLNPWEPGDRILDILGDRNSFIEGAELNYILVKRQPLVNGAIDFISLDLERAYDDSNSQENIEILARDEIYVFNAEFSRESIIDTLLNESVPFSDYSDRNNITVEGLVGFPGRFPYEANMTVRKALNASGGIRHPGDNSRILIERLDGTQISTFFVDQNSNYELLPGDIIVVNEILGYQAPRSVTISGQVRSPGTYFAAVGESVQDIIERAGGYTDFANPSGIIVRKQRLIELERRSRQSSVEQLQAQIRNLGGSADINLDLINALISDYLDSEIIGRVNTVDDADLNQQLANITIENNDTIYIPESSYTVSVFGEVNIPGSFVYIEDNNVLDYVDIAGSFLASANDRELLLISPSGKISTLRRGGIFNRQNRLDMIPQPGDVILVTPDLRLNFQQNLNIASSVTAIIYQTAVALAAVNSFNN
ncbi:MAG: SLBB domain-containing protein [Betaproteobacteria bacterium]